jgi:MFS family permease
MVQSFNVPTADVAKYAGMMSAVFSMSQAFTGIAWGRASDRFGRKPMIMAALTSTMIAGVLFGFSRSLTWAFAARSIQGLSNGNVGIIRTAVAELVPEKELQPRAFSVMPLVWTVGSIFGPAFGGSLVHPVERFPAIFGHSDLFKRYPFALPNVLTSLLFLIGITCGFLFLRETLEDKKHQRDYGLVLGRLLTSSCRKRDRKAWRIDADGDANEPFLARAGSAMSSPTAASKHAAAFAQPNKKPQGEWKQVFTPQSNVNLAVYTFLAMHSVAYDQLLPVFFHHPVQPITSPDVHLPLRFAGGFGIGSSTIGMWFMIYGIYGMLIQFLIFPPLAKKWGVLNCLKLCTIMFPFVYLATPFTALLPTDRSRQGVNLCLMLVKGFCAIFSFPCSTILLTNSAASLKVLGTLNGVATSISAVGRAAGPAISGVAFTKGVEMGYVLLSWWILAGIAVIGAVPVWWLVEMDGFGTVVEEEDQEEDQVDFDDSADFEQDVVNDADERQTSALSKDADTTQSQSHLQVRKARSHPAFANADDVDDNDDALLVNEGSPLLMPLDGQRRSYSSASRSRQAGGDGEENSLRRMPSPLGMPAGGIGGRSRRYSTEIGASRSGWGTGGTSYH